MLNIEQAMKDGGSFSVIRNRLLASAGDFRDSIASLDAQRRDEFGGVSLDILTNVNLLTHSLCKPVDIAKVGDLLVFGFDSDIGMKSRLEVEDVLAAYELKENEAGGFEVHEVSLANTFLASPEFTKVFEKHTKYNRNFRLRQLFVENDVLYMVASIDPQGKEFAHFTFVNGSEGFKYEDYSLYLPKRNVAEVPEWSKTTDADIVTGIHPHISVCNKVFVETVGGDLTIKTSDDTTDGKGIYAEDVDSKEQRVGDAEVKYIDLGDLVLLSIKPLSERERFFVYNVPTQKVIRCDALEDGFVILEGDGGVIFSNGYAVAGGEMKVYNAEDTNARYHAHVMSPSGEDVLYAFYNIAESTYTIYHYNLVNKKIAPPIHSNGFTSRKDGKLLVFRSSQNSKMEKLHKLQVWNSPFMSQENYVELQAGKVDTPLTRIGNPTLVSGISDCYSVLDLCESEEISEALYETILTMSDKLTDTHYWLSSSDVGAPYDHIVKVRESALQVLAEFKKVKELNAESESLVSDLNEKFGRVKHSVSTLTGQSPQPYIDALHGVKGYIGSLIAAKDKRYIDLSRLEELQSQSVLLKDEVVDKLISKLQHKQSFEVFYSALKDIDKEAGKAGNSKTLDKSIAALTQTSESLQSLSSEVNELDSDDSTQITAIITNLGEVFTSINSLTAKLSSKRKALVESELKDQFAAQMVQISQVIEVALASSNTPEQCDAQSQELNAQFEKLELRFAESDEYLEQIREKCSDALQSVEAKKESLQSELSAKIQKLANSADVSIQSITAKVSTFDSIEDVHTFFQSNVLVERLNNNLERIVGMGDSVLAGTYSQKLKMLRSEAITSTRDRADLYEKGGSIIKLGKHRFSVNSRTPEFNIVESNGVPTAIVASTGFKQEVVDERLGALSDYYGMTVPTESEELYRGAYLAYLVIRHIKDNKLDSNGYADEMVDQWRFDRTDALDSLFDEVMKSNYDGGFVRGVHDVDAKKIFQTVYPMVGSSDTGVFSVSETRQNALMLAKNLSNDGMASALIDGLRDARNLMSIEVAKESGMATLSAIEAVKSAWKIAAVGSASVGSLVLGETGSEELRQNVPSDEQFTAIAEYLLACYKECSIRLVLPKEVGDISDYVIENIPENLRSSVNFDTFAALVTHNFPSLSVDLIKEGFTAFKLVGADKVELAFEDKNSQFVVEGLVGEHKSLMSGELSGDVELFVNACDEQFEVHGPKFVELVKLRQVISREMQEHLRLEELKPKPMAGFVRNELIKKCYLPMVGDSLASQIGTLGSNKAGQSGGLLLMSPPGYGKTTLLEYLSNAMGMLFVKVNGPAIGHNVTSIIPDEADSAAAKSELEKLNFALEMGDNVLVVIDDIQHLHPEFLQKFISLCDGTRRIEGQWNGVTKTYDMKGKRFAIAMAGNPYTEQGEAFKVPDMLSNRMSSYNLGDVMTGMELAFELSYIENCLSSNTVTEVLSSREPEDIMTVVKMARGDSEVAPSLMQHPYSQGELVELVDVVRHMLAVQSVVLEVNKRYIESAAQASAYRTEPPFLLQGSYRNMAKMSEKLVGAMTEQDVQALISDHYKAESQTLTVGAEENFIRIKEILGTETEADKARWAEIVAKYQEQQSPEESIEAASLESIAKSLGVIAEFASASK